MNINEVVQLIGSLGFPIVACGALFWKLNKDEERHEAETDKLAEALENNTIALNKLANKMEGDRWDD